MADEPLRFDQRAINALALLETAFLCPGSSQIISRAVHLARLNAGWSICDECDWRMNTEGLAEKTVLTAERIRDHRANGILRTEFGFRGQHINELDRRTTSDLARVFCFCLHEQSAFAASNEDSMAGSRIKSARAASNSSSSSPNDLQPTLEKLAPVVIGYDGRNSSPDIFVGVTSAIREFGLPVIDIGRSTAASIQEAARTLPDCCGSVFVTGAGMPNSWTGLDVSDAAGDPIPVVWKDFGVRLLHISQESTTAHNTSRVSGESADDALSQMIERMRSQGQAPVQDRSSHTRRLRLLLPAVEERTRWMSRLSRQSGEHRLLDFEPKYREWLARWYPPQNGLRIHVRSDDMLIHQRVAWLAEHSNMELVSRPLHDASTIRSCHMTMTINEDDRQFSLENGNGTVISPERLAAMLNVAVHSAASQVTAHADSASGRFWLTDAGRSASDRLTEHVRDSLALLGLISKLLITDRLSLDG